ncbi:MAG TPA: hypothetical protein VJL28_06515 [Gemmatimonadaceae bacterium]|nr:hypothetical protein [Gemmatimonadaceae bacterium]
MIGLQRFLDALHKHHVEFIVIGGIAARVHGSARITQDVDVVYGRSDENVARIVKALAPFKPFLRGAPPDLPFEWSVRTVKAGLNFTLRTTIGDIDILGEVTGGGRYEDLVAHTVTVDALGHPTFVVNLEWLIRLKRAAGRPRDLEAIAELELLQELGAKKS